MDSYLQNKKKLYFVCTNFDSSKDGIGHYTAKIVKEIKENYFLEVYVFTNNTYYLNYFKLFFSLKMSLQLIKAFGIIKKNRADKNYIFLEYPFVEYNPLIFIILFILKLQKKSSDKIILSLHEYSRTKKIRKNFINKMIKLSDVVLYTRDEDVKTFKANDKIVFIKRTIPANIEPSQNKIIKRKKEIINLCFFGIVNYRTKEIENMIKAWKIFNNGKMERLKFHIITSSFDNTLADMKQINYHYNLKDNEVSNLLQEMNFMILPLKPKISIHNGSLSAGCIHRCIPIGIFDLDYFDSKFGIQMDNYSVESFLKVYEKILTLNDSEINEKVKSAYNYGKNKTIANAVKKYLEIVI